MRTAHELLDVSTHGGRYLICHCGHWQWKAPWQEARETGDSSYDEHVELWEQAEAELDEAESA